MKEKFGLNSDVFLVRGAKRGTIYDLSTGDIYSIDSDSVKILQKCEESFPIQHIIQTLPHIDPEEIEKYLEKLASFNLGIFLSKEQGHISKIQLDVASKKLNFAWLELTPKCNLRCIHCYTDSHHTKDTDLLSTEEWTRLLHELNGLGCKQIQFIGGEPLLFGKDLFKLIKVAKRLDFEMIELYTNATLLTEKDIRFLIENGICIATSIYSNRASIHNQITQHPQSFDKTVGNVKKLKEGGLKVRCNMVVMRQNEDYIDETMKFLKDLGSFDSNRPYDIVRPIGRGAKDVLSEKLQSMRLMTIPNFSKLIKQEFIRKRSGNSCWQSKICIASNGDIIPCIMAREEVAGNIKENNLEKILNNGVVKFWGLSKDKVAICKDCEYRYACSDCRPVVRGQTSNLFAKSPDCMYDPYAGEWHTAKEVV